MRKRRVQLVVKADEPALFFSSAAAAENWLEAIDVEEGTYPFAIDRAGNIFAVRPYKNNAKLERAAGQPADLDLLRSTIVSFLTAQRVQFEPTDTLEHLLYLCEPYVCV